MNQMAFLGKVLKKNDHYVVQLRFWTLDLPGARSIADVCLLYRSMRSIIRKDVCEVYKKEWNGAHVLDLATNPEAHLPRMEHVCEQIKAELPLMQDRPAVPNEMFWICPRRTAVLAFENAIHDLNNVKGEI